MKREKIKPQEIKLKQNNKKRTQTRAAASQQAAISSLTLLQWMAL